MTIYINQSNTAGIETETEIINKDFQKRENIEININNILRDNSKEYKKIKISKKLLKDVLKLLETKDKKEELILFVGAENSPVVLEIGKNKGIIAPIINYD